MAYEIQNTALVDYYPLERLRGFVSDFLRALGASSEEADIISDGLMTA
ncbi:MAG: Ldh family oxidoreductase, partial [Chloroflexi bacterium]|nr:Ldh family oxidoreductase [Chloroflexota bacterium]